MYLKDIGTINTEDRNIENLINQPRKNKSFR